MTTELGKKKWEGSGEETVGLVLRMCEQIFSTGKCVVLNGGFCVCSKGDRSLVGVRCLRCRAHQEAKNTGPRVYRDMPLTNTSPDEDVTRVDMLEDINE